MGAAAGKIAVFGAGGFGLEVAMLIEQINAAGGRWELVGFFDDGRAPGEVVNGLPVLGGMDALNAWPEPLAVAIAIGAPGPRRKVVGRVSNPHVAHPVLVHPSVICGNRAYVAIGEGSIVCAGTIITTNIAIGRHVIINLACTVGHESTIGDFASLMPAVNISGEVVVGPGTYWGTGAKVINGKAVGENTVIGAGAVVVTDLPADVTAVGCPARAIKAHHA